MLSIECKQLTTLYTIGTLYMQCDRRTLYMQCDWLTLHTYNTLCMQCDWHILQAIVDTLYKQLLTHSTCDSHEQQAMVDTLYMWFTRAMRLAHSKCNAVETLYTQLSWHISWHILQPAPALRNFLKICYVVSDWSLLIT